MYKAILHQFVAEMISDCRPLPLCAMNPSTGEPWKDYFFSRYPVPLHSSQGFVASFAEKPGIRISIDLLQSLCKRDIICRAQWQHSGTVALLAFFSVGHAPS
jgi:hypothetical protein